MVASTQKSVGGTSDNSLETTIETRSIKGCLNGYFCSDVVFNLINEVLPDTEINILGKGLGFTLHFRLSMNQIWKKISKILPEKWDVSGILGTT